MPRKKDKKKKRKKGLALGKRGSFSVPRGTGETPSVGGRKNKARDRAMRMRRRGRGTGLPPGLAKMSKLPPGLAKQSPLPSGLIAKQASEPPAGRPAAEKISGTPRRRNNQRRKDIIARRMQRMKTGGAPKQPFGASNYQRPEPRGRNLTPGVPRGRALGKGQTKPVDRNVIRRRYARNFK